PPGISPISDSAGRRALRRRSSHESLLGPGYMHDAGPACRQAGRLGRLIKIMKTNKSWHARHRMPKSATTEQRLAWHLEHQKHCQCRPIPESLRLLAAKQGAKRISGKK